MLRPARAGATLVYLLTGLVMGVAAATVLVVGWITAAVLAITPLVIGVLVGLRYAVGALAVAEAWLARALVGARVRAPLAPPQRARGFWRTGLVVLNDRAFWRQQTFLLARFGFGTIAAIAELALIAGGLGALAFPAVHAHAHFGSHTLTLTESLAGVPAGIIALVIAYALLGPLERTSCWLADGLLGGDDRVREPAPEPQAPAAPEPSSAPGDRQILAMAAVTIGGVSLVLIVIWAATGGRFWPGWTIVSLGLPFAFYAWLVALRERPDLPARMHVTRAMAVHLGAAGVLSAYFFLIWVLSGSSDFWPIWPILGLFATLVVHEIIDLNRSIRQGPLAQRITELETTRAGAANEQEAQLRRIERDLHDGAQARLVALGMSLGMAQQKLASDPEAAQALLADARLGAQEALAELRDLARGIHPPVLADRGLEAAITALADRTPLPVDVAVTLAERPPPAVETAAYFVVAEALANAAKHAHAQAIEIAVGRVGRSLVVEITDDGVGGARATGSGLSGLARRVQALDGTLSVDSPGGGPTRIRAVMPCAS